MNNNILLPAAKVDTALPKGSKPRQLRTSTTTTQYTGPWTNTQVVHLLKRSMFGATLADVNHMLTLTMSQAVDELLNTITPTPPIPARITSYLSLLAQLLLLQQEARPQQRALLSPDRLMALPSLRHSQEHLPTKHQST